MHASFAFAAAAVLLAGCAGQPSNADESLTEAGHGAYAALQEIVAYLEADPSTDWSTVDLGALRDHLVDMDEVILRSNATVVEVPGGFEATVSGEGRTVGAIQRMVTEHTHRGLALHAGWQATVENRAGGVVLRVTSQEPGEETHIRGLGFYGLMATDAHHQEHHLEMARGRGMAHHGM